MGKQDMRTQNEQAYYGNLKEENYARANPEGLLPSSNTGVTEGYGFGGDNSDPPGIPFEALFEAHTVDYLTLTTYDSVMANIMRELFYDYAVKPLSPTKLMQYDAMQSYDKRLVVGRGWQRMPNGERQSHNILKASGEIANEIYKDTCEYEYKCTRIDLQVTPYINTVDYDSLFDCLKRYVSVSYIQSNTPTINVGSRTSDRYIRIYQHRFNDAQIYDRFEVEYKKSRAQLVFDNPDQHQAYLLAEVYRLSRYTEDGALDSFTSQLAGVTPEQARTARKQQQKGIDFYLKVVSPYLRRVIENPDFKAVIRYDLEQLDMFDE